MMKDIFVGPLKEVHALNNDKTVSNGQIIAYRSGDHVELQNLNLPDSSVHMKYDAGTNELVFSVRLNDGDFVVLQDKIGIAGKRELR